MATPPLNSTTVIVDDDDPSLIYSGIWIRGGSVNEFGGTTHGSMLSGASVQLKFRGTSVTVYGTVGLDTPRSSYSIDDSSPSIYAAGKTRVTLFQNLFFQSPTLSDGEHTLVVTNLGTGALWIDYILYTRSNPLSSSTSSLPPPTPSSLSPTLTPSTVTPTPSKTPIISSPSPKPSSTSSSGTGSPSQANSNASNGKSSIPVLAVVGGAIGALILIIVLVFGMLYYRKRAKRLAGANLLEKKDIFGDSSEHDKPSAGAVVTPYTSAYTPGPHTASGYGSSNMSIYPPGPAYPQSDYNYPDQPSTPIYHFSNNYALRSGYNPSSEHTPTSATGHGYTEMGYGGSQYGGTQYDYANTISHQNHLQNPHSQYEVQQQTYASSDRLVAPQRRGSLGSAESHTSLAYMSSDRVAMDPYAPLPDALPGPSPTQATQRTEKGGLVVHNDSIPELRQHEDGGVRLDVRQPQGSNSEQQQVIDLPPTYKPNY